MQNNKFLTYVKIIINKLIALLQVDKKLFINFLSLGLVQFTNFALPLLTYPYLFRTVGDSYFGSITYALNVYIYLAAFTDYGFNLSAPRSVILARNDISCLSTIVSTVLQTKLYFFLFCSTIVIIGIIFTNKLEQDIWLYTFGFLYLAGSCVLPTWLFQGLEDMRHITWINLIAKLGATFLIFMVIKQPVDYYYAIGLFGIANLVSGVIGIVYACHTYKLTLRWQSVSKISAEVRAGFYYFLSSFSSVAFSNSTIFILGFFVANDVIGKYAIAEKIIFAAWQLISIFSQATYPVICRLAIESHKSVLTFIKKYYIPFTIFIGLLCAFVAVLAEEIVHIINDFNQPDIVLILRILCLFPFVVCLNVSAYQLLLVYEKQKVNALIFNASIVVNTTSCIILSSMYGAVGAACSTVFTQIVVTLTLHWVLATRYPKYALWIRG